MERKHLRIPRSLLKHEKTRKEFTNDFLPSEEKFHSSSSTQEADPHGTAPHLDFIHLQALLCSSLPQSSAGTFNEESDVHGLLFDLFGDVITREK